MEIDSNLQIIIDCLEIGGIGLFMMIGAYLWRLRYEVEGYRRYAADNEKGCKRYIYIALVLGAALVVKLILAAHYKGYETDMNCFYSWSDMIYENGFGNFYSLDAFTDYPPGYMAILWVVEFISRIFSIETASVASRVMIKLVPILADLGAGFVIWRMAKEKFSEGSACTLAGVYVISPIVLMDSSVWGQTDSVFTLCVLLVGMFCMQKKRIPAYFAFVIGAFIKPQTLIFAPILIWTIVEQVFIEDFDIKKFVRDLIGGLSAIALFFVMALPFGVGAVMKQYIETLGQYEYGSVNAYNIWAFLGKNWASQDDIMFGLPLRVWGSVGLLAAVILSGVIFFILRKKNDESRYFASMAVVIGTMFLFSVRMHERYMFPIVVLVLAAFVIKPVREMYAVFAGFAFLQFMNVGHVYKNVVVNGASSAPTGGIIGVTALLTVGVYGYMWFAFTRSSEILPFSNEIKSKGRKASTRFTSVKSEDEEPVREPRRRFSIKPTKRLPRMNRTDFIVLFAIIAVYGTFALINLGSTDAPQTEWRSDGATDTELVFDLGEDKHIDMVYTYLGHNEGRRFTLDLSQDGVSYETVGELKADDVFHWDRVKKEDEDQESYNLAKDYRYLKLTVHDQDCFIREIVITDEERNIFTPVNAGEYETLFDEQDTFEYPVTWRSGTYFDEIYHARTANEMINSQYNYENTHPPLGKFLIGIGIRLFGMDPFGWRIIGTLFGIGMLPILYLFARRLFDGSTLISGAATGLFAFDFMHFSQTRIATIDVYGTFFIIAMFFFMYVYSQMSFYDTKLVKTFLPLLLAAVSMGLGCASKWTAVYASAGMGIFFFAVMIRRYREYRIAKADPDGSTEGIEHKHITAVWMKYTLITLGVCVLLFIVLAGVIYLLSYIPFSNGDESMSLWDRMIKNQVDMYNYHANLDATHPYSSVWYEWPTMIRPVFYYSGTTLDGLKEGISAMGNPLVWWVGIPVFIYMIYRCIRYSDGKAMFLSYAYLVQLAPWILVSRCTFAYHYFPSVPFVVLMIAYTIKILDDREDKHWRKWIYVYLGSAFVLFILFYPVLSGVSVDGNYIRDGLKWLPSWALYI